MAALTDKSQKGAYSATNYSTENIFQINCPRPWEEFQSIITYLEIISSSLLERMYLAMPSLKCAPLN